MPRAISGQYTIQSDNTAEKVVGGDSIGGSVIRVRNIGSNPIYVGNNGSNDVDDTNGYKIDSGSETTIRLDDVLEGGPVDLYVYGTSGDTLAYLTIA